MTEEGRLSPAHATTIADTLTTLTPDQQATVEQFRQRYERVQRREVHAAEDNYLAIVAGLWKEDAAVIAACGPWMRPEHIGALARLQGGDWHGRRRVLPPAPPSTSEKGDV